MGSDTITTAEVIRLGARDLVKANTIIGICHNNLGQMPADETSAQMDENFLIARKLIIELLVDVAGFTFDDLREIAMDIDRENKSIRNLERL